MPWRIVDLEPVLCGIYAGCCFAYETFDCHMTDWNLSDALTKKALECRQGLLLFLKTWVWKLKYDPEFVVSARKARKLGKSALDEMKDNSNNPQAVTVMDFNTIKIILY